jgi:hypothetical protein
MPTPLSPSFTPHLHLIYTDTDSAELLMPTPLSPAPPFQSCQRPLRRSISTCISTHLHLHQRTPGSALSLASDRLRSSKATSLRVARRAPSPDLPARRSWRGKGLKVAEQAAALRTEPAPPPLACPRAAARSRPGEGGGGREAGRRRRARLHQARQRQEEEVSGCLGRPPGWTPRAHLGWPFLPTYLLFASAAAMGASGKLRVVQGAAAGMRNSG